MRYLGMDYGSKTLGLSISDKTGLIAGGYKTLRYEDINELISELRSIVSKEKIDAFVLGNPKNLDNSLSDRSKLTFEFKEILEKEFDLKVYMQDERLSTVEAEKLLISNNTRRKNRKKVIDKIASVIILQSFLDRKANGYEE